MALGSFQTLQSASGPCLSRLCLCIVCVPAELYMRFLVVIFPVLKRFTTLTGFKSATECYRNKHPRLLGGPSSAQLASCFITAVCLN